MDPGIPVPPTAYGGIERIVALLALEYKQLGHTVELLTSRGSSLDGIKCHSIGPDGFPYKKWVRWIAVVKAWKFLLIKRNEFDLIHNFGRLIYLLPMLNHQVKKLMSYQREISKRNIKWINKLPNQNLIFTGCSQDLVSRGNVAGKWEVVYNAIDFSKYDLVEKVPDNAPLIFLGRLERVKGCHTAIKVALETGNRLIIAGNISPLKSEQGYFEKEIKPFIDGERIIYVGPLNDEQKNHYLSLAKALLFPIEWDEPFGIVMIEAMACGTPVLAFNKGSVSEVVQNGITGWRTSDFEKLKSLILQIQSIDRKKCRETAMSHFDIPKIASTYLSLF
jgi:glycosyltransferase involved in cell wall biosynthesis